MLTVKVQKSDLGGYIAMQEGDTPLRYIAAAGETEAQAVAALFEYHADLIRKGRIDVNELKLDAVNILKYEETLRRAVSSVFLKELNKQAKDIPYLIVHPSVNKILRSNCLLDTIQVDGTYNSVWGSHVVAVSEEAPSTVSEIIIYSSNKPIPAEVVDFYSKLEKEISVEEVVNNVLGYAVNECQLDHTQRWLETYDIPIWSELDRYKQQLVQMRIGLELHIRANYTGISELDIINKE